MGAAPDEYAGAYVIVEEVNRMFVSRVSEREGNIGLSLRPRDSSNAPRQSRRERLAVWLIEWDQAER
jgi:hypothetical protein